MRTLSQRAQAHADDVLHAFTTRGLVKGAHIFKSFLGRVLDSGLDVPSEEIDRVLAMAEQVIVRVEAVIERPKASYEVKLELVELIYAMRERIEQIARWRRHTRK